jgi:hypothetical protein
MKDYTDTESNALSRMPSTVKFEGRAYDRTGFFGREIATGTPTAEYQNTEGGFDRRCWVTISGRNLGDC